MDDMSQFPETNQGKTPEPVPKDLSVAKQSPATLAPGTPFHLAGLLEERLQVLRRRPKRQRTRAQILAATARQMERLGYEGLTVESITEPLGIARGTFYLHFRDRSHAALAVLRLYHALRSRFRPRGGSALPVREAITQFNVYYVAVYARNAQLLLGRESLMRDRQELARRGNQLNAKWAERVLADVSKRQPHALSAADQAQLLLRIRGALAMTDELLRQIFLVRAAGLERFSGDERAVVTAISDMWFRLVYAEVGSCAVAPPQRMVAAHEVSKCAAS